MPFLGVARFTCVDFAAAVDFALALFKEAFAATDFATARFVPDEEERATTRDADFAELLATGFLSLAAPDFFVACVFVVGFLAAAFAAIAKSPLFFAVPPIWSII